MPYILLDTVCNGTRCVWHIHSRLGRMRQVRMYICMHMHCALGPTSQTRQSPTAKVLRILFNPVVHIHRAWASGCQAGWFEVLQGPDGASFCPDSSARRSKAIERRQRVDSALGPAATWARPAA